MGRLGSILAGLMLCLGAAIGALWLLSLFFFTGVVLGSEDGKIVQIDSYEGLLGLGIAQIAPRGPRGLPIQPSTFVFRPLTNLYHGYWPVLPIAIGYSRGWTTHVTLPAWIPVIALIAFPI